ncbi:MFS transporter [Agrobacterium tumefaciens]|uniref:MFS transporter n=1 Tax=Agrobacterium tumefaciens TaxID=358 RepID=UPI0009774DB0
MIRSRTSLKLSSFHWFLLATFVSAVGRNSYNIACSWLLAASGGGVAVVATFFIISSVTEMVASPVCGWICDRYDRRRLAIIADCFRASAAVALGLLVSLENFHWYVLVSTLVFATCDRLSLTAMQSMIPHVAKRHSLPVANSATFFFMQVGSLVAAASMGLILFVSTPAVSFWGMALCFAGSVLAMMFMAWERKAGTAISDQSSSVLCISAPLLRLGLIYSTLYLGGLLISAVGPTFVFEELQGNALDFGHLESAWSAGSILGAVLLIPFARVAKPITLQFIVLLITAVAFASIKLSSFPWALLAVCVIGASYNLGRVAIEVALQSIVPHAALGRAKGLLHCSAMGFGVASLGLIASFPDGFWPTTIFLTYSALVSMVGLALRR